MNLSFKRDSEEYKQISKLDSEKIRERINSNKIFNELGRDILEKRKDFTKGEIMSDLFNGFLDAGAVILFLSLFYFGALPVYFGVNNEFQNPSNPNISIQNSFTTAGHTLYNVFFVDIMNKGAEHPVFWFWFWWFIVFMFLVLPIIRAIRLWIINSRRKKNDQNVK